MDSKEYERILKSNEYRVFERLSKQYYLINGSKFGALFLAYLNDPATNHADSLVFTEGTLPYMSRMSTISKKSCIYIDPGTLKKYSIVHNTSNANRKSNSNLRNLPNS